jgi:transcriptional regulator with XRE-family HTH domain
MTTATRELGAFLRTRRERLVPGDLGLPARDRRRTPGLRREEVAELAGVSTDYVVRLEQGRDLRPSPQVLEGLSRALRLSEDERVYLFDLAGHRTPGRSGANEPPPALARLIEDLSPLPAMLVNHRFDILAWNAEMARLMAIDFGALPRERRNTMWLCLLHPPCRTFYRDREATLRQGIAGLRAAWAAHPEDKALADLIDELTGRSEEFARMWPERAVKVLGRGTKPVLHPVAGELAVDFEVLAPLENPDQRVIVYRASDPASQLALDRICAAPPCGST